MDGSGSELDKATINSVINEKNIVQQKSCFPVLINAAEVHFDFKKRFKTGFDWIFQHV